ncbi:MAG: LEA type 2 family protein [Bacteroidota bacterium]
MKFKILLIIFSLSFLSCRELKELNVSNVENFKMTKVSLENLEAEIGIKINNPNKMGFSIYPSEFLVNFSGIPLGNARLYKRVHIKGNSDQVYTFKLNSDLSKLNPMDLLKLMGSEKSGNIEVKGNLKVGKFLLRRKIPISYIDKVKLFK